MGLDINLVKIKDYKKYLEAIEKDKQLTDARNAIWDRELDGRDYNELSKSAVNKILDILEVEISRKFPDLKHYLYSEDCYTTINDEFAGYTIGYLRSSYNGLGFNSVSFKATGVGGYYYIFGVPYDYEDYIIKVDWKESINRAIKLMWLIINDAHIDSDTKIEDIPGEKLGSNIASALSIDIKTIDIDEENKQYFVEECLKTIRICAYVLGKPDSEKYYLSWSA